MKKTLLALAVTGLFAAPAFAASGNVDVYGKLRVSLSYLQDDLSGSDSWWSVDDQSSRIGFKGTEDLGGGLKAIWQIEQGLSSMPFTGYNYGVGTGSLASRNTFVGLSGGFGTMLIGNHDTPYKLAGSADLFADTQLDAQGFGGLTQGIIGFGGVFSTFDLRASNAVAYISPDYSGFHAAAAIIPGDDLTDAYSLAMFYRNGPLNASFGYENHNNLLDESAWKINAGYVFGDLTLGATYEKQDYDYANVDGDAWLVSAAYAMGPITLAAQYGDRELFELQRLTLGVTYALSKRTNVLVAYSHDDAEYVNAELNTFTMQLNHDF